MAIDLGSNLRVSSVSSLKWKAERSASSAAGCEALIRTLTLLLDQGTGLCLMAESLTRGMADG